MKMNFLSQQWLLLKLAVVFLTRIPVPIKQEIDDELLNKATGYFGVVGCLVAGLCALVLWSVALYFPVSIAVLLSMAFGLMLTGAFHEDGLADTADGFGGGWSVSQKLTIMKDSRLGTYGASALCLALLLKYQVLVLIAEVGVGFAIGALFIAHIVSRTMAISIIPALDYVQLDNNSKTKPVAQQVNTSSLSILFLSMILGLSLSSVFIHLSFTHWLGLVLALLIARYAFITFCNKQIGGYTGDVLGGAQQVFELLIYLVLFLVAGGR